MKILALDIATTTGWATDTASGTWTFKPKRGESEGMRVVRFKATVSEVIRLEQINIVAYERPAGRHTASIMVASEMIGVLKELCQQASVQYASYSATEIKKYWTGKGNCSKDVMVAEAKKRHPEMTIIDDNHADALALLSLAKTDLL